MRLRKVFFAGYLLLLALATIAVVMRPVAFQKSNAIRLASVAIPPIEAGASFDVYPVLSAIPKGHDTCMVWDVDPDAKYERTIVEGRGNCSNLVFGLARYLELSGVDFQILHLMDPSKFLTGTGHTVIRTRFRLAGRQNLGLVDIFAGGVPRSGSRFLDIGDLERGPIPDFDFLTWGGRPQRARRFYQGFLEEIEIGWISAQEVAEYFAFIEAVHVSLGSKRLEKYVFDGLALLLGFYPRIYVSAVMPFIRVNPLEWPFYNAVLWLLRSALVLLPLFSWLVWRDRSRG